MNKTDLHYELCGATLTPKAINYILEDYEKARTLEACGDIIGQVNGLLKENAEIKKEKECRDIEVNIYERKMNELKADKNLYRVIIKDQLNDYVELDKKKEYHENNEQMLRAIVELYKKSEDKLEERIKILHQDYNSIEFTAEQAEKRERILKQKLERTDTWRRKTNLKSFQDIELKEILGDK